MPRNSRRRRNQHIAAPKTRPQEEPALLAAEPRWHERWRTRIRTGETAVAACFWVGGLAASDMVIAFILFGLCLLTGIVAIAADPTGSKSKKMGLAAAVVITVGSGAAITMWRHEPPPQSADTAQDISHIKSAVDDLLRDSGFRSAQIAKLDEINGFIGRKDEATLRDMFDLSGMIYNNLGMVRDGFLEPGAASKYAQYFVGGQAFLDLRFMQRLPDKNNAIQYTTVGNASFNLSKKFVDTYTRLKEYENDAFVPPSVKIALAAFDAAVDHDKMYMSDVINGLIKINKNYVLYFDDAKSEYSGVALSTYNVNTQNLRSEAVKVNQAIHDYLIHPE
jgi:hypothetical protein